MLGAEAMRSVLVAIVLLLVPRTSKATDNDFQLWPVARVNHAID